MKASEYRGYTYLASLRGAGRRGVAVQMRRLVEHVLLTTLELSHHWLTNKLRAKLAAFRVCVSNGCSRHVLGGVLMHS